MNKQFQTISLEGFDVAIDRDAEVPIGVQLAWALRTRIRDGRFKPSQRLPGLRDLAEAIGVNVNTVRAVYQRLEHEGLIDSQQGSGTFVASTPHKPPAPPRDGSDAPERRRAGGSPNPARTPPRHPPGGDRRTDAGRRYRRHG